MLLRKISLGRYLSIRSFHINRLAKPSPRLSEVQLEFRDGFVQLAVPLPSRHETCVFQFKPFYTTIGDFLDALKKEDRGVDHASVYLTDGSRLSRKIPLEFIFEDSFILRINDSSYNVQPSELFTSDKSIEDTLSDISNSITKLYYDLRLEQYTMYREYQLENHLKMLHESIRPLNQMHHQLSNKAIRRLKWIQWSILGGMAFQTGILFRLVWIDYSWDIMEPFTYFVSFSAVFITYCYYVLRRMDMKYMNMSDYIYLKILHHLFRKNKFDVTTFNSLKNEIMIVEHDLKRLRDPLDRIVGIS